MSRQGRFRKSWANPYGKKEKRGNGPIPARINPGESLLAGAERLKTGSPMAGLPAHDGGLLRVRVANFITRKVRTNKNGQNSKHGIHQLLSLYSFKRDDQRRFNKPFSWGGKYRKPLKTRSYISLNSAKPFDFGCQIVYYSHLQSNHLNLSKFIEVFNGIGPNPIHS